MHAASSWELEPLDVRRRERFTRIIQGMQTAQQKRVLGALASGRPFRMPLPLRILSRLPGIRDIPARIVAFGVRRVRLEHPEERPAA